MPPEPSTLHRRRELLAAAETTMRRRLADPDLDLGDVAAATGTSKRQLQRVFAEMGTGDYRTPLLLIRMKRARQLLERGQSVRSVALRVGYRGPSGLAAAFRRIYGVSPSTVQPRTPEYLGDWTPPP
jgi:AraC family transcriptional regulator of adaptative response / methylphosphotriester-DNA alkyltransferase methyltransferase